MTQYEREEQQLEDDLAAGRITQGEYNAQMREMNRSYRDELQQQAEDAYEIVMARGY